MVSLSDVDVMFDEIANQFDARNWLNLPDSVKWWLRFHDKDGIEIYANTQHYEQVDIAFRRLVNRLYVVQKLIGSPRPAATKPKPKRVWGVIMYRQHDPKIYKWETDTGEKKVRSAVNFPNFFLIRKRYVDIYDTSFKAKGDDETQLRHLNRVCATCGYTKEVHI